MGTACLPMDISELFLSALFFSCIACFLLVACVCVCVLLAFFPRWRLALGGWYLFVDYSWLRLGGCSSELPCWQNFFVWWPWQVIFWELPKLVSWYIFLAWSWSPAKTLLSPAKRWRPGSLSQEQVEKRTGISTSMLPVFGLLWYPRSQPSPVCRSRDLQFIPTWEIPGFYR